MIECSVHPGTTLEGLPVCPKCWRETHKRLAEVEGREQNALTLMGTLRDLFVSTDGDDYNVIDKVDALLLKRAKVIPGGLARKRDAAKNRTETP